jgi:hypothetical protein
VGTRREGERERQVGGVGWGERGLKNFVWAMQERYEGNMDAGVVNMKERI